MPLYEYHCTCGHKFTENKRVSERNVPVDEPCPSCHQTGGMTRPIGNPSITYGGMSMSKVPDGFKDKLREVKKMNPRSNIHI